jgi:dTDP-4-dehydrorhamnose reductase
MHNQILVLGEGNLGSSFRDKFSEFIFLSRNEIDFNNIDSLENILENYEVSAIINTIAYTKVDLAEEQEEIATQINAYAPEKIAKFCKKRDIIFIHYSTDYVFDGSKQESYNEQDVPNPLGVYGRTKLLGDELIAKIGGKYLIFRTSWVYSEFASNFVKTIIRLIGEKEKLQIVSDQEGCPSYAGNLAKNTIAALDKAMNMKKFPSGIYNLSANNSTTWYEFAKLITEIARKQDFQVIVKEIMPIIASEYPTKAVRPKNSMLDCKKFTDIFKIDLMNFQQELEECIGKYAKQRKN